jgi:hypothetical protein
VREQQQRRAGEQRTGSGGDQRRSRRDDLGGSRGRHVTTDAHEIVKLVPQMQERLFHGEPIYVRHAARGVRALTVAPAVKSLAGDLRPA